MGISKTLDDILGFGLDLVLLPGSGNQDAGRFFILSYFYGFLIIRSEQELAPTVWRIGRWRIAGRPMDVYRCVHTYVYVYLYACICTCVCMCMHMYRLAANNQ